MVWCILWVVVVVGGGTRGNILLFFVHGKSPSRSLSARPRSLFAPGRVTASHYRSLLSRETDSTRVNLDRGLCSTVSADRQGTRCIWLNPSYTDGMERARLVRGGGGGGGAAPSGSAAGSS